MGGMFGSRPRCDIEAQLEVVVVAGGVVAQQQRTVHVELHPEVERQGRTSVRVQPVTVRRTPTFRCIFR